MGKCYWQHKDDNTGQKQGVKKYLTAEGRENEGVIERRSEKQGVRYWQRKIVSKRMRIHKTHSRKDIKLELSFSPGCQSYNLVMLKSLRSWCYTFCILWAMNLVKTLMYSMQHCTYGNNWYVWMTPLQDAEPGSPYVLYGIHVPLTTTYCLVNARRVYLFSVSVWFSFTELLAKTSQLQKFSYCIFPTHMYFLQCPKHEQTIVIPYFLE